MTRKNHEPPGLRLAFVCALSDEKLAQKLGPLAAMEEVASIDLFRRRAFEGAKIRWRPVPRLVARARAAYEILRVVDLVASAGRFDALIGCHQRYHGLAAALAGRLRGVPVVQIAITDVDWLWRQAPCRWSLQTARACAVRGERSLRRLRELGFAGPIEVLANPFDAPDRPEIQAQPVRDLIAVGDLAHAKDYPWMLEVLARVRDRIPSVRLGIAGRGPFARFLGRHLDRLGLVAHVELLGERTRVELDQEMRRSRALLLTSSFEGLPMAVVEGMAASLPVFVTAVGELPGLVTDGVEGRLVPHGHTDAMALAIASGLSDPEGLVRMGARARDRVEAFARNCRIPAIQAAWRALLPVSPHGTGHLSKRV